VYGDVLFIRFNNRWLAGRPVVDGLALAANLTSPSLTQTYSTCSRILI